MDILGFIGGLVSPVTNLIDDLHTSDEEKLQLKKELTLIQNQFASKVLDYETKLMESQAKVITSEANGQSWLQRNWRPMMMVVFGFIVVSYFFGFVGQNIDKEIVKELFNLIKIGIGGYIVGRSAEKVAPKVAESFGRNNNG